MPTRDFAAFYPPRIKFLQKQPVFSKNLTETVISAEYIQEKSIISRH